VDEIGTMALCLAGRLLSSASCAESPAGRNRQGGRPGGTGLFVALWPELTDAEKWEPLVKLSQ
jgi:hypothetical protein